MEKLYYGSVRANGIKIQYYRTGEDKQPIVMLHGITDSGLCWNYLAMALEPEFDVVLLDARGHGMSEKPADGYDARNLAEDVAGVIKQLNLVQPVIIGHSLGAATAALLAANHPDQVKCLVLEDPPIGDMLWGDPLYDNDQLAQTWRTRIEEYRRMSLDEIQQACQAKHPNWDPSEIFLWSKAKQLVSPDASKSMGAKGTTWREMLAAIKCPVLLVIGDPALGGIVSQEIVDEAMSLLPNGTYIHIHGAGHNIRRDQYQQYYSAVRTFLRKYGRRR